MAAAPPAQPSVDSPESATREVYYRLSGTGLRTATVREPATFSIEACDDKGAARRILHALVQTEQRRVKELGLVDSYQRIRAQRGRDTIE